MRINAASHQVPDRAKRSSNWLAWFVKVALTFLMAALPTAPLLSLLVPQRALADDADRRPSNRQKVLILRSDGTGVTEQQRQSVTKELQAQALRYRQLDIVLANGDLTEEMFEFECTEPGVECLSKIGNKYASQLVVYSELAKNPSGQLQVNMRVIDVVQGRVAQTTVQPLDQVDKPGQAVQRGLVVLLGPVDMPADTADAVGTVQVVLFGGGVALVYIDDKLVGRTSVGGLKVQVAAGTHTLRVVRAGFKEWTAKISVAAGASVEQAVQLEQQSVVAEQPGGGGPARTTAEPVTRQWWFWTLVGVGVAAIGTGAYFLLKPADAPKTGTMAVSLDHVEAYLDPVFAGSAK